MLCSYAMVLRAISRGMLLALAFCMHVASTNSAQADHKTTLQWLSKASDIQLSYHVRRKFGDDPTKLEYSPISVPEQCAEIRSLLETVSQNGNTGIYREIDERLAKAITRNHVMYLVAWQQERQMQERLLYFFVRLTAEAYDETGIIQKSYEWMPDDWEIKQDWQSLAKTAVENNFNMHELHLDCSRLEDEALKYVKEHLPPDEAQAIRAEYLRARDADAVRAFEDRWIRENRPEIHTRQRIAWIRELQELKGRYELLLSKERFDTIRSGNSPLGNAFLTLVEKVQRDERDHREGDAVLHLRLAAEMFWDAWEDSLRAQAARLDPQTQWFDHLKIYQKLTLQVTKSSHVSAKEFLGYDLLDSESLKMQIEAAGDRLEIGRSEVAVPAVDMHLIDERYVLLSTDLGLLKFDLESRQTEQLMTDIPQGASLLSTSVTADGKFAYATSSEPAVMRYDLSSGARDTNFRAPAISRRDALVAISPDGRHFALSNINRVTIYEAQSGRVVSELSGGIPVLRGMLFTGDGNYLVCYGRNQKLAVRHVRGDSKLSLSIPAPPDRRQTPYPIRVTRAANGWLIGCFENGGLAVWKDVRDGDPFFHVWLPYDVMQHFRWADITPNQQFLVSNIGVWDLSTSQMMFRFEAEMTRKPMRMSSDGQRLLVADRTLLHSVPLALLPPDQMSAVEGLPRPSEQMKHQLTDNEKPRESAAAETGPEDAAAPEPQPRDELAEIYEFRTWTNHRGNTVEARLISYDGKNVTIEDRRKRKFTFPSVLLSPEDRKLLRQIRFKR